CADAGDLDAARKYLEEGLAIARKTLPAGHPVAGAGLSNLGLVHLKRGDPKAALGCFERALASDRRGLGPEHPGTATTLNNRGSALADLGRQPEAWQSYREAAALFARVAARLLAGSAERSHAGLVAQWRTSCDNLLALAAESPDLAGRHA